MPRLILMRHAKTEPWFEGVDDRARALTERGFADARLVGDALLKRGWTVEVALVSTARRARETWFEMARLMPGVTRHLVDELYLASSRTLLDAAQAASASDILVIGHNPGMHSAALELVRHDRNVASEIIEGLAYKFPTSAAAVFETDDAERRDSWRCVDFIQAKTLRGLTP